MRFLAIDPGETTGWAKFTNGLPSEMGECQTPQLFYRWLFNLEAEEFKHCVAEQYIIRPPGSGGFNHTWGKVPTIRVLGAVEAWCELHEIPLVYQNSDILTAGAARFNLPHPKKKSLPNRNAISAIIHGKMWWEEKGVKLAAASQHERSSPNTARQ